jgi:hypothetical protein
MPNKGSNELIQQERFYNDSLSGRLSDRSLGFMPIPEFLTVHGIYRETALGLITAAQMENKANQYEVDEEMVISLEKLHYSLINNVPVQKKHLLRIIPDFKMELNIPIDKLDKAKPVALDFFKRLAEEKEAKKYNRNKDFFNA